MRRTTFPIAGNAARLNELQALVGKNEHDRATILYAQLCQVDLAAARQQVEQETEFLRIVTASRAIGFAHSGRGLTPRQAIIYAAAVGWYGDDPCSWQSPVAETDLLAWANSHYQGPHAHLSLALEATFAEGLFVAVHPGVFSETCYSCTFDVGFLDELHDAAEIRVLWEGLAQDYDEKYGLRWRQYGLCAGQGSQGASGSWGPCLGMSRVWFREGAKACNWELRFARH